MHGLWRGVGSVTPETVHFIAQVIRHQRGLATAAERWVKSAEFSRDEALDAIYTFRRVLDSYEAQLSQVEIREEEPVTSRR
jgi:hypothetical protein